MEKNIQVLSSIVKSRGSRARNVRGSVYIIGRRVLVARGSTILMTVGLFSTRRTLSGWSSPPSRKLSRYSIVARCRPMAFLRRMHSSDRVTRLENYAFRSSKLREHSRALLSRSPRQNRNYTFRRTLVVCRKGGNETSALSLYGWCFRAPYSFYSRITEAYRIRLIRFELSASSSRSMLYKAIVEMMVCDRVRSFGIPISFRDLLDQIRRHCRLLCIDLHTVFLYV